MCPANKTNSRDSLAAGQRELNLHIGDAVLKLRDVQKHNGIQEVKRKLQAEPTTQQVWVVRGFVTGNTDGSIKEDPSAWLIKIEGPFTAEGAARKMLEYSKSLCGCKSQGHHQMWRRASHVEGSRNTFRQAKARSNCSSTTPRQV
jgi:hypothetical protein